LRHRADRDVRSITVLQSDLIERDRRLGGQRQDVLLSTLAALRTQYDVAAHVQLLRERRTMAAKSVHTYADDVDPALKRFDTVKGDLQQFDMISPASARMAVVRDALEFVKHTLMQYP